MLIRQIFARNSSGQKHKSEEEGRQQQVKEKEEAEGRAWQADLAATLHLHIKHLWYPVEWAKLQGAQCVIKQIRAVIAHSALQGIPRSSSASLRSFLEKLWLIHTQREFNLHLEMQMYLKSEQAGQVEQTDSFRVLFSLVFFLNWMPLVGELNWNGRLVSCISHVASGCLSSRGAILVFFPFEIKCQTHIGCRCRRRRRRRWGWLTRPRLGLTLTDLVGLVVCPAIPLSWLLFLCYLMLWRLSVTLLCFLLPRDMDLAWQSLRICSQPGCPSALVLAERKFDLRRILFWFQFNFLRRLSSANNN